MRPATHVMRALAIVFVPACISSPGILGAADDGSGSGSMGALDPSTTGAASMTGNQGDASTGGDEAGDSTGGAPSCPTPDRFGPELVLEASFTPAQWDGAVADLIGVDARIARDDGTAESVDGFDLGISANAETEQRVPFWAAQAAEAADLSALLGCDPATVSGDAAVTCFTAFVYPLAETAWRRPLDDAERSALDDLLGTTGTFAGDVRRAIASVLESPTFWQLHPSGTPTADPAVLALDGPSLALRMSLRLWLGLPDDALRTAGADGSLLDPAVRAAQIERMLADPRAARMVGDFHEQWLRIRDITSVAKDAAVFPAFDPQLAAAMREESTRFAIDVILAGDARAETLLTAPYTFANAELAAIYGDAIQDPPAGAGFERVELDPVQRGGILTQPAWLSMRSRPAFVGFARRGLWIRDGLLCTPVPPPPPNVQTDVDPPAPGTGMGNKAWRDALMMDAAECTTCHQLIDPFSFAFDNYDAIGQWVDEVFDAPVDPSGMLDDQVFTNRGELIDLLLTASEGVPACMPEKWAGYGLGRLLTEDDACLIDQLRDTFASSDGDIRELIASVVASDAFAHMRSPQ